MKECSLALRWRQSAALRDLDHRLEPYQPLLVIRYNFDYLIDAVSKTLELAVHQHHLAQTRENAIERAHINESRYYPTDGVQLASDPEPPVPGRALVL